MAKAPTVGPGRPFTSEVTLSDGRLGFPPFGPSPPRRHAVGPERCRDVLGTLRDVSQAAPDLNGCRQLLELISGEVRAEQAVLILSNPLTGDLEFVVHEQDPEIPKRYADYYCELDPTGLPAYITGSLRVPVGAPSYSVSDLTEVVDYASFVSTEFYNDFLKSAKIHYDLVAFLSPNTGLGEPSAFIAPASESRFRTKTSPYSTSSLRSSGTTWNACYRPVYSRSCRRRQARE